MVARDGDRGGSRRRVQHADLRDMTREELYERAQEADIHGRSMMSKCELVDALAERR
jgi:DNA end-binding protein Ku